MKTFGLVVLVLGCCAVGCLSAARATRFNVLLDQHRVKNARNEKCSPIWCAPDGGACKSRERPGPMCKWDQECTRAHVCQKLPVKDEKCFEGTQCRPPYTCTNNTRCVVAGVGDSCETTDDCSGPYLCDDGYCQMARYALPGETCNQWDGPKCDSAAGFQCRLYDDTCIKAHTKKEGEPCVDPYECPLLHVCDGVCHNPFLQKDVGEPCSFFECKEGLVCSSYEEPGVCIKPGYVPIGKLCTVEADCGAGGTCQCNYDTGNMTCFKVIPSAQKLVDTEIAIMKCAELYRYDPEGLFRCKLDLMRLMRTLVPWQISCVDP